MFIEEISIDGFKSYAQRVTVPGFDRYFNAITGLNGSGKSNILDSICFVLGITNLSQVRANSLQELVYKQGQAGVTKATVSITFNNLDKANSPVGYEQHDRLVVTRQLVIGGRNKYLINGHNAQPARVQNLFHSVQLNVNNPHFLIMQGRITKVLNMKPAEILGMLEEAAGTRMYESKKDAALRTLDKKQVKLDEIDKLLQEDILPALEKLRKERGQFMEWQAAEAKLSHLRRFCAAFRYHDSRQLQTRGQEEMAATRAKVQEFVEQSASLEQDAKQKEAHIKALQREKEAQSSGEVKQLAGTVDQLSKRLVKDTTVWNNKKESMEAELAAAQQMEASIQELAESDLQTRLAAATAVRDEAAAGAERAATAVEAAQRELAGAEAGDGRNESNQSLQEQLEAAQNAQTTAEAEGKQADIRCKHLQKQLAEQQKALKAKQKEAAQLQQELNREQATVEDCSSRLEALMFDEDAVRQLEATVAQERAAVQKCQERVDELNSQLAGVSFQYQAPEANFAHSKVKGVVAKLIRVQDPATTTALEVAAGGRLYQVVVDSEQTAKALLSKGCLRNRVTIIPLNKVKGGTASGQARTSAAKLSSGSAQLALELVGFDQDLSTAMQYVFGNAFVCKDSATAKKLAFHKDVHMRCITLEGDDFNPGGLLTGGSRNSSRSMLTRLHALSEAEAELGRHKRVQEQALERLRKLACAAQEHNRLKQELDVKQHALGLLRQRIAGSESAQLAEAVKASEQELAEAKEAAAAAQQKRKDMVKAAKDIEGQIANFGATKGKRIQAAQNKVAAAKTTLEKAKVAAKTAAQAHLQAVAEGEAAAGERKSLAAQLQVTQQAIQELEVEVAALAVGVAAVKREYDAQAAQLEALRERLRDCDGEIGTLVQEKAAVAQQAADAGLNRRKTEHKLSKMEKDIQESAELCKKLEKEYPWIVTEKHFFGRPGSDFDFEAHDVDAAFQELQGAQDSQQRLANRVNRKVIQMFDKAESEYKELSGRKQIVLNDRHKIEQVIAELDEKKREALEDTWRKVNQDFGSIFSTLLPGTSAALDPQEGESFLAGLEVKVAFGGVWKQSLTELSGGQRSLLALSLILAMLLFKPAPIYILDEVDAALDLSHTQNIGRMIKSHFPYSQFIVVSLKEGMFNNANVIFRTKFVDGVSAVTRTVPDRRGTEQPQGRQKAVAARTDRAVLAENIRH